MPCHTSVPKKWLCSIQNPTRDVTIYTLLSRFLKERCFFCASPASGTHLTPVTGPLNCLSPAKGRTSAPFIIFPPSAHLEINHCMLSNQSRNKCKCCQAMPSHFSHVWLCATPWTVACQAPLSIDSPGKNTGVGYHALLPGVFRTQGSNSCLLSLLHWQVGSLPLAPPAPKACWQQYLRDNSVPNTKNNNSKKLIKCLQCRQGLY